MGAPGPVNPVILFDGVCNLCNQSVLFIIRHDPQRKFRFASLQSEFGQQQMQARYLNTTQLNTVLLLHNGKIYQKSRAALEIVRRLNGLWPLLYLFIIVPPFIRNGVYNWIARNRYRWFGKQDACSIPTPELQSLFIS
ncbi:MAG: thiol-disulfide oxidoreductase DCC family protein [Cytophagales bacterium]|nr:thiol-disulfide oxidoreductase DCC family protein [Cytophagales bacterium]